MFNQFEWRHLPALFTATVSTVAILWPTTSPRRALLAFGFPLPIADSPAAAPVMMIAQVRTTTIGLVMFILYFKGQMEALDVIMAVYGTIAGIIDSYTVWKQGRRKRAIYRLATSGIGAACGIIGVTAGN
ncbi:hypothetical protein F5Y16DRAFT_269778 [Xylariaceae sp. FL0255]|nr:hypothetical protein F5Y16DRAFT_269778 [Xylariaceae sp. FL0255]